MMIVAAPSTAYTTSMMRRLVTTLRLVVAASAVVCRRVDHPRLAAYLGDHPAAFHGRDRGHPAHRADSQNSRYGGRR